MMPKEKSKWNASSLYRTCLKYKTLLIALCLVLALFGIIRTFKDDSIANDAPTESENKEIYPWDSSPTEQEIPKAPVLPSVSSKEIPQSTPAPVVVPVEEKTPQLSNAKDGLWNSVRLPGWVVPIHYNLDL